MAENQENNDRFTTYWTGPKDPRALAYVGKLGLSFDTLGRSKKGPESRDTLTTAVLVANQISNAEERLRHQQDTELPTGIGYSRSERWMNKTHDEKLSLCKITIERYDQEVLKQERLRSEKNLGSIGDDLGQWFRASDRMFELAKAMKKAVEAEKEPGWDWKVGLTQQEDIHTRMIQVLSEAAVIQAKLNESWNGV